jgi:hypothetical protein
MMGGLGNVSVLGAVVLSVVCLSVMGMIGSGIGMMKDLCIGLLVSTYGCLGLMYGWIIGL